MDFFVSAQHIQQLQRVYIDISFRGNKLEVDQKRPYGDSCGTELTLARTIGLDLFEDENGEQHLSLAQFKQMKQMHADLVYLFEIIIQHMEPGQLTPEHADIIRQTKWVEVDGHITMSNDIDCDARTLQNIRVTFNELANQANIAPGWWHRDVHGQWNHTKEIVEDEPLDIFGEMRVALSQKQVDRHLVHLLLNTHTEGLTDYTIDTLLTRINAHNQGMITFDPKRSKTTAVGPLE